jgi:hypothetical protein
MTVTLTFDATLDRVLINANGLGAATTALIESSTDQVRWATVRGGGAVSVTAGALDTPLSDYEFTPGTLTYYRVSGVTASPISFVAAGVANQGVNASVTPALPASIVAGDLLVILASIRNSGTGTVNVPTGWTAIFTAGNVSLLGRRYVAGDTAPVVTFTGGVALADTMARMFAFRNAELTASASAALLNGSAQNIAYPALTVPAAGALVLIAGWKQDDWTTVAALAGMTEIADNPVTGGDDAGQVLDYVVQTTATNIAAGSFVVTGGAAAISRGLSVAFMHAAYITQQSASITPATTTACGASGIWLKSVARPFLSMAVQVINTNPMTVARPARAGVFNIVGRSLPVAVSDVRLSRRWTLLVRTETDVDATNFDLLMASGDILLIQVPTGCNVPGGYVSVGDVQRAAHPLRPLSVLWTLPVIEVAPPGPDVVGALGTWQTVLSTYATWSTELAAKATWADLLTLVASPSEVIVP